MIPILATTRLKTPEDFNNQFSVVQKGELAKWVWILNNIKNNYHSLRVENTCFL